MKIEILNPEVIPGHHAKGITQCKITYTGKGTDGDRKVKVNYMLSGDDNIWFVENGIETKNVGPKDHIFPAGGKIITEDLTIKVKASHASKIGFIKIHAEDQQGFQESKNKGITYG